MDITITVNFWFLVSMCLTFALIGAVMGARAARGHGERFRY